MKAKLMLIVAIMIACLLLLLIFLTGMVGGGAGSVSSPVVTFATEEEAYQYQYVGTELGVPWDIVILADGIHAKAANISGLEDYNPLLTSLQFCILVEEKFELEEWEEEVKTIGKNGKVTIRYERKSKWVSKEIQQYEAKSKILEYIELEEEELSYADVNQLIKAVYDKAAEKGTDDIKYEVTLISNPDYEDVLRKYICLDEKHIQYVLELYDTNYMGVLYGYSYEFKDIQLPEIIQGDVTRMQLAEVAISLINHPYMMGGKSGYQGTPEGPLDCSGYVDWVYIQCFGSGVSNGKIPEGVTVSGTALMWYACEPITAGELQVGDLGFIYDPAFMRSGQVNHVGIFLGVSDGREYWIHCGGSYYGTDSLPTGRVGISLKSGTNSYNPVNDTEFEPAMKGCRFKYFRRPQFAFREESEE